MKRYAEESPSLCVKHSKPSAIDFWEECYLKDLSNFTLFRDIKDMILSP